MTERDHLWKSHIVQLLKFESSLEDHYLCNLCHNILYFTDLLWKQLAVEWNIQTKGHELNCDSMKACITVLDFWGGMWFEIPFRAFDTDRA